MLTLSGWVVVGLLLISFVALPYSWWLFSKECAGFPINWRLFIPIYGFTAYSRWTHRNYCQSCGGKNQDAGQEF